MNSETQLVKDIITFLQLHYTAFPVSAVMYQFHISYDEAMEALTIINELKD